LALLKIPINILAGKYGYHSRTVLYNINTKRCCVQTLKYA
jgi:hypothetical protein